jgi:hypothetical protein
MIGCGVTGLKTSVGADEAPTLAADSERRKISAAEREAWADESFSFNTRGAIGDSTQSDWLGGDWTNARELGVCAGPEPTEGSGSAALVDEDKGATNWEAGELAPTGFDGATMFGAEFGAGVARDAGGPATELGVEPKREGPEAVGVTAAAVGRMDGGVDVP